MIEKISPLELVPYEKNSRLHTPAQINQIVKSIKEFGFTNPVLIDNKNGIIAGHARVEASKKIGMKEIPCIRLSDLSPAQKKAYIIADNKLALNAGWDDNALKIEFTELKDLDFDLSLTGFDNGEIDQIIIGNGKDGLTDQDAIPDVGEEPISKRGDLWVLGDHRLLCGDSMEPDDLERLLIGKKAEMIFTDPPYTLFGNSTGVSGISDDKMVRPFFREIAKSAVAHVEMFGHVYICCDWHSAFVIQSVFAETGLTAKNLCIWDKGDGGVGANYQQCYEFVWFFSNSPKAKGTMANKLPGEKTVNGVPNIWRFRRVNANNRMHNAEKPVEMVSIPIANGSQPGGVVMDLFLGSGTTIIACEKLGRKCRGIEISPHYCDVIIKRWEEFTGKKAVLETARELVTA